MSWKVSFHQLSVYCLALCLQCRSLPSHILRCLVYVDLMNKLISHYTGKLIQSSFSIGILFYHSFFLQKITSLKYQGMYSKQRYDLRAQLKERKTFWFRNSPLLSIISDTLWERSEKWSSEYPESLRITNCWELKNVYKVYCSNTELWDKPS